MEREAFFKRYSISEADFAESGIEWSAVERIVEAYAKIVPALESVGRYVVDALLKCSKVHSIKYRLKEPEHLAEKIIRKCRADADRRITEENFREQITDLVGIRALHLFKEDWIAVHNYICTTWSLAEKPVAYVRAGDSEDVIQYYRDNNCEIKEHRFGYRSVHYLIESRPDREKYIVEIQARTVFEEAWGEIDHVISYPYHTENELLVRLSMILNRLAANADELGSYMRYLKTRTDFTESEYRQRIREKNDIIENLRNKIDALQIDHEQKQALTSSLNELRTNRSHEAEFAERFPWLENFMESNLFKDITDRISTIVNSDEFRGIELSDTDIQLLSNAQRDLMRLVDSPEMMAEVMKQRPILDTLRRIESGGDHEPATGDAPEGPAGSSDPASGDPTDRS